MSVDRDELRVPSTKTDRHNKVTAVEFSTSDGDASIFVPSLGEPFAVLLEMLAPESVGRLGPEAAAVRRQAKQAEDQKKLEAGREANEEKTRDAAGNSQNLRWNLGSRKRRRPTSRRWPVGPP